MPELKLFNPQTASESYFKGRHEYLGSRLLEETPDDPNMSLEFSIKNAQSWSLIESIAFEVWHLWEDKKIIAELFLTVNFDENNLHLMFLELQILEPYRRKGYTRPLLERVVAFAEKHKRTLATGTTNSFVPDGRGFAERVGATKGIEESTNQLVLTEVDRELLADWADLAHARTYEFEMGFWGSRYPEAEIDAIAELFTVMNSAPRDDLEMEDWQTTPEELREFEAYDLARDVERWVLYVRHKLSGCLAGFTETHWYPEGPENLEQNNTGVLPEYRGNGLGRWLKAAMIQKVLVARPVVKRVRTGNANSNAPMLAINTRLGFKHYKSKVVWQLEIARLKDYLKQKP